MSIKGLLIGDLRSKIGWLEAENGRLRRRNTELWGVIDEELIEQRAVMDDITNRLENMVVTAAKAEFAEDSQNICPKLRDELWAMLRDYGTDDILEEVQSRVIDVMYKREV